MYTDVQLRAVPAAAGEVTGPGVGGRPAARAGGNPQGARPRSLSWWLPRPRLTCVSHARERARLPPRLEAGLLWVRFLEWLDLSSHFTPFHPHFF